MRWGFIVAAAEDGVVLLPETSVESQIAVTPRATVSGGGESLGGPLPARHPASTHTI